MHPSTLSPEFRNMWGDLQPKLPKIPSKRSSLRIPMTAWRRTYCAIKSECWCGRIVGSTRCQRARAHFKTTWWGLVTPTIKTQMSTLRPCSCPLINRINPKENRDLGLGLWGKPHKRGILYCRILIATWLKGSYTAAQTIRLTRCCTGCHHWISKSIIINTYSSRIVGSRVMGMWKAWIWWRSMMCLRSHYWFDRENLIKNSL